MDDDGQLLERLAAKGFRIEQRQHEGQAVWTWTDPRRSEIRQPMFLDEGQAARYVEEQLRREGLFR